MRIAIIPARGGSKRIPNKNIRDFLGRPMICWSIETAQKSGMFDHVVVSTDSESIAEVAQTSGAIVPFIRPSELSDDHTPVREVINHAIRESNKSLGEFNYCCCIFATAPLLQTTDLEIAFEILMNSSSNFVFSAAEYDFPIQRAFYKTSNGIEMFFPEHTKTRSQDLVKSFHDAGMFYWGKTSAFLNREPMFSGLSIPYVLPSHRVCDIDDMDDWQRAQWLMKVMQTESVQHG